MQVPVKNNPQFTDDRLSLDTVLSVVTDCVESAQATVRPEQIAELHKFIEWADACAVKIKFAYSKKRLREKLWADNPHCRFCGRAVPPGEITLDHFIPRAKGGADVPANYMLVCVWCNRLKAALLPEEFIQLLQSMVSRVEGMMQDGEGVSL